jgi:CheY-like chemotaxis protein
VRRVFAVVSDLFFSVRIAAEAKRAGVALTLLQPAQALDRCAAAPPDLLLLDLHAEREPLALVRALRADERTRTLRVVGFYSHVEDAIRKAALAAGIDAAMPRSAFVGRLRELLAGELYSHADPPTPEP